MDDAPGLEAVVKDLISADSYALDTEFHRERTYYARLALLQIAWNDQIVLVDPLAVDVGQLRDVLVRDVPCVMHAASQDLAILERACGALPGLLVDTQIAAGFVGLGSPGLGVLLQRRLGMTVPKADRLTDWLHRPLGRSAAAYAAADVAHLHALWDSLAEELEQRGRLSWALDECEGIRLRYGEPLDPEQAWWRIKEARRLKGRARHVAQTVAAWRERRAQRVDRPVRHVLPDLAVVAIAERPPRGRDQLQRVRGLDGRHLRGGAAAELLKAIEQGVTLSDGDLRVPERDGIDPAVRPSVALASAWISQIAHDLHLDASLLATRADIEALVRGDGSSRLLSGWRAEVAGEPVRRLLSGQAALAFNGDGGLLIEARSHRPITEGASDAQLDREASTRGRKR